MFIVVWELSGFVGFAPDIFVLDGLLREEWSKAALPFKEGVIFRLREGDEDSTGGGEETARDMGAGERVAEREPLESISV